jgi:type IV secretory pathway VirB10-like protein
MTTGGEKEQQSAPTPEVPPDLRLRGERPRVTRLSRKVLIGMGCVSALAVAGALGYALQTRNTAGTGQELLSTQNRPSAEGLAGLPKDYTGLPRQAPPLGPALPGDLGRPMLNAGAASNTAVPATTPDPEAQRRAQEIEAARVSRLFAQTDQQPQSVTQIMPGASAGAAATPATTPPVDAGSAQNMQDRKTAFLTASTDKRTVSPDRLEAKASPYVVQAGTVIPAALITGIRSDLPGQITAQVTEAVYDSPTGKYLLIPQGAKLIGQYDSSVAFGQSRILLVWTRIIMPDGTSIVLERQPGADTEGYAGLRTRSITIGACCSRPPCCRPCSASAPRPGQVRTRTIWCRRSVAVPPTVSARPASRSFSVSSTSSRPLPFGRASRFGSSSHTIWCWRLTAREARRHDEVEARCPYRRQAGQSHH